ncbi:unnamed protein product, partial [Amoebophrya sp. A120]
CLPLPRGAGPHPGAGIPAFRKGRPPLFSNPARLSCASRAPTPAAVGGPLRMAGPSLRVSRVSYAAATFPWVSSKMHIVARPPWGVLAKCKPARRLVAPPPSRWARGRRA